VFAEDTRGGRARDGGVSRGADARGDKLRAGGTKAWLLFANFNHRTVGNSCVDLLNFGVGQSNASRCPIDEPVKPAEYPQAIADAVNHDVRSRINIHLTSAFHVDLARIRNAQGSVKGARLLVLDDSINAFRGFLVSLSFFRANGCPPEGHAILSNDRRASQEGKGSGTLFDHDSIRFYA